MFIVKHLNGKRFPNLENEIEDLWPADITELAGLSIVKYNLGVEFSHSLEKKS